MTRPPRREAARRNRDERAGQLGLFAVNPATALEFLRRIGQEIDAIGDDTPEAIREKSAALRKATLTPIGCDRMRRATSGPQLFPAAPAGQTRNHYGFHN